MRTDVSEESAAFTLFYLQDGGSSLLWNIYVSTRLHGVLLKITLQLPPLAPQMSQHNYYLHTDKPYKLIWGPVQNHYMSTVSLSTLRQLLLWWKRVRFVKSHKRIAQHFNPLNAELNPICCLLALLGAHHFLHVSRIRVKSLTLRLLMSYIYIYIYIYIYGAPILDVSRSHTTTQHSR